MLQLLLRRLLLSRLLSRGPGPAASAARVAPAPSASPPFSPDVTPRLPLATTDPPAPPPAPPAPLRVHVATFNAAGLVPAPDELLPPAFCGFGGRAAAAAAAAAPPAAPDLLFVCTQETGGSTAAWERCVLRSLEALQAQEKGANTTTLPQKPPPSFSVVARRTLRGSGMVLHAAAFASSSLRLVRPPLTARVATGLLNVVGNKGGAALALTVARRPWPALPPLPLAGLGFGGGGGRGVGFFRKRKGVEGKGDNNSEPCARLVLIGAHLAAHEGRAARRNADAARIARGVSRAFGAGWLGEEEGDHEDEGAEDSVSLLSEAARRAAVASGSGCGLLSLLLCGGGGGGRRRRRRSGRVAPWPSPPQAAAAPSPGVVIWAGDLNYRAAPGGEAEAAAMAEQEEEEEEEQEDGDGESASARKRPEELWAALAAGVDELTRERLPGLTGGCDALRGYNEAPLAFAPTFKLERRRVVGAAADEGQGRRWCWPAGLLLLRQHRRPLSRHPTESRAPLLPQDHQRHPRYSRKRNASWTDRVLWREIGGRGPRGGAKAVGNGGGSGNVRQLYYGPVRAVKHDDAAKLSVLERSDHRAVVAGFEVGLGAA